MLRVHPIDPIPSEGSHHAYHAVAYPPTPRRRSYPLCGIALDTPVNTRCLIIILIVLPPHYRAPELIVRCSHVRLDCYAPPIPWTNIFLPMTSVTNSQMALPVLLFTSGHDHLL